VYFGPDPKGLGGFEVAVAVVDHAPTVGELKQLHKARLDGRDTSLVVAVTNGGSVWMFGPDTSLQAQKQSVEGAARQLQAALDEGDSLQATKRFLSLADAENQTQMSGVRNRGLFATYHLRENTKKRADWSRLQAESARIVHSRSRDLIEDLGFVVSETDNHTLVLNDSADHTRAVALLLDESESFENESPRFRSSPVAWGLSIAAERGVPWLIMLRREQIRLYPARDGVGVGQKGQTETYLELDLAALSEEYLGLLTLVFSAEALGDKGTAQELLDDSVRYATALGTRLRERIYDRVVPELAKAVALELRRLGKALDAQGLEDAYRTTLRILFRFLFQAYAEDRGLLPAGRNPHFDAHSLTRFASGAVEETADYGDDTTIWQMLQEVWEAVDVGNEAWKVPAYNGGLFGSDPELRPFGALIKQLSLPDSVIGPALEALLIDNTEDQVAGMVDFRSLSVREFGTIYEGLLESSLSLAESDLTLDANGTWLPAGPGDSVEARKGEPYFHNSSGERKATGSYFTPDFIVDHLIERAIDPSLDEHLSRIRQLLDEGKENDAAKNFFDYRVADLAMGSAHFLVAAVDRIESKMRSFLAQPGNEIAGVSNELERLAEAARKALGDDLVAIDDIDDAILLRRQIARRCVYGIDVNPLAVELSRLALWIHTFVPGLPMSTLDHNLVCGNSLTGISSIEEAEKALELSGNESQLSVFESVIRDALEDANELLAQWSDASEATRAEVSRAHELAKAAEEKSQPVKGMLDVALASIAGVIDRKQILQPDQLSALAELEKVRDFIASVNPAHMPFLFPEVFVRDNPGFDAIVGNPPWETLVPDERKFWAMKFPGLMGHPVSERTLLIENYRRNRPDLVEEMDRQSQSMASQRLLLQRKFSLGAGHVDLSEAFAWAFYALIRNSGRVGIVLPKTAFSSQGLADWRRAVLATGCVESLVTITNSGQWAFNIHPQFSIALSVIAKGIDSKTKISGPFSNKSDFISSRDGGARWDNSTLLTLTESSAFPNVGTQQAAEVLAMMRRLPSLSNWEGLKVRPVQELNATSDRHHFDHDAPSEPVLVLSGRGFNIWTPSTGEIFATAEYETVRSELVRRLANQMKLAKSAFYGKKWPEDFGGMLPFERPRIALRGMTNPTNTRTLIPALVPGHRILPHTAPYLLVPAGETAREAFLLAALSSIPLDWYSRKFVESSLMNHFLNAFPIPLFDDSRRTKRIVTLAGSLASVNDDYVDWAMSVGVPVGSLLDPNERESAIFELDALVSLAYGLEREHVQHIFETFHRGWDYGPRLARVLEFFDEWKAKE
jgi:hypothetical protein